MSGNSSCSAGTLTAATCSANPCDASANSSKTGSDGVFYCINGGTIGGTTESCACTSCNAGYEGDNCHTAILCVEDHRVHANNSCVVCGTGRSNVAGDNAAGTETQCDCALDERVVDNLCVSCPSGTTREAKSDVTGNDTVCAPIAYVELLVVNDKKRCDAFEVKRQAGGVGPFGPTELATMHAHTASVVAAVNQIFTQSLNFGTATRVLLTGQVDWCDGDQLNVSYFNPSKDASIMRDGYPDGETNTTTLLSAFGAWREYALSSIPFHNDVAHLFTGRDLLGDSKGGAYQYSACSDDSSWCGAVDPSDSSKTLRDGDCGFDSRIGEYGATVCCYARRGGAVSSVADPSNAHTVQTGYDASDLIFESALVVAHHLGKQLGMDIDGIGNSSNCASFGHVMSSSTTDDTKRPAAYGAFSKFSECSAATLERQLPTYSCMFTEAARSVCGNGVVEMERGEECDCGGGEDDGVCLVSKGSFKNDAYCNSLTCLFLEDDGNAVPPPTPFPPPVAYQPHGWCDFGCGEAVTKGSSGFITDVPSNKCLRCATQFLQDDCSDTDAPFKGWEDDNGGTRDTNCAWTGCAASNGGCGAGETVSETVQCASDDGAGGSIEATNIKCCKRESLWTCCGVLDCILLDAYSPPPPPPPASPPPPPNAPFPPPPAPVYNASWGWGWGLISDDDELQGDAAEEGSAVDVAISSDGSRIAIGASNADGTGGMRYGGRTRVFEYNSTNWVQVGDDLVGNGTFGKNVGLSKDGKLVVVAAPGEGNDYAGVVRVYEETDSNWTQLAQNLTGDEDFSWYGSDVLISTTNTKRVFVAGGKTTDGVFAGIVRAYEYRAPSDDPEKANLGWLQVGGDITDYAFASITQSSGTHHASLRTNLGVSDDGLTLAIGTPLSTTNGDESAGAVRVYKYKAKAWTLMDVLSFSDGTDNADDLFGAAVAVSGDGTRVAIGAPGYSNGVGRVGVYELKEATSEWDIKAEIGGERRYDGFGASIDLSTDGSRIAVGAAGFDGDAQDDGWGEDAGKTRLFEFDGSDFIELGSGPVGEAAGDSSGSSIGLSGLGTRVVIASVGNDGGTLVDAGVARVYEWRSAPDATVMPPPPRPRLRTTSTRRRLQARRRPHHRTRRRRRWLRRGVNSAKTWMETQATRSRRL